MENLILTVFSKNEFKEVIKNCVLEALNEQKPTVINSDTDKPLTIKEVSEFLKLSVPTIYGYVHQQLIPCNKKGNRLYFFKSELISWIQEGKRKTMNDIKKEAEEYILRHPRRR